MLQELTLYNLQTTNGETTNANKGFLTTTKQHYEPMSPIWINLKNETKLNLNSIRVRLIDSYGEVIQGLYGNTELTIQLRRHPEHVRMINLTKQINETIYEKFSQDNKHYFDKMPRGQ